MEELVFAIPTDELWKLIPYKKTGFIKGNGDLLSKIIKQGLFGKRSELEEDPSFKQIIPYAVISHKESFYLFQRTTSQTEQRLHNKFTLGVGGHMNPDGSQDQDEGYLMNELQREFFEEVKLQGDCKIEDIKFIGYINDDSITVGRHHIGLLYHIRVSNKDIVVNEPDKMTADWIDKTDLSNFSEKLETWSKITFDEYIKDAGC